MCLSIGRKCSFCDYSRHVTWDKCQDYWNLYKEAIENNDLDSRPVPEDCSNLDMFFKTMVIGKCMNMPKCPSYEIWMKIMYRRARLAEMERLRLEAEQRKRNEFAAKYFFRHPILQREEPVPFMEMIKESKLKRQQELLQSTKQKLLELKKRMGMACENKTIESDSDENDQPATPKRNEAVGYELKRAPVNDDLGVYSVRTNSPPVDLPSLSMGRGVPPASQLVNWELLSHSMASGSDEFVTTSGSQLTTRSNSPERGTNTPPTDLTDGEGVNHVDNNNDAHERAEQYYNDTTHDASESELATDESYDNSVPSDYLGIASRGAESPLFPGFLGLGDLENNVSNQTNENMGIYPQFWPVDNEDNSGYDADASDIGDDDPSNDESNESSTAIHTPTSTTQSLDTEVTADVLVMPPPGLGQFLSQPKYDGTPPNFQGALKSWPAEATTSNHMLVHPPPGLGQSIAQPKHDGTPPNLQGVLTTKNADRGLIRPPPGFGQSIAQPKYAGTPPNFQRALNPWLAEPTTSNILVRPPPGFGQSVAQPKYDGTPPNFQSVLGIRNSDGDLIRPPPGLGQSIAQPKYDGIPPNFQNVFDTMNSNGGLIRPPPGFGDIAERPIHEGVPPNFQDVLNPWLTKPKASIKTDQLHAYAEIQSSTQNVADELSKMKKDNDKKPNNSRLWNPLRGLKKMFTMSLIVGKCIRQN